MTSASFVPHQTPSARSAALARTNKLYYEKVPVATRQRRAHMAVSLRLLRAHLAKTRKVLKGEPEGNLEAQRQGCYELTRSWYETNVKYSQVSLEGEANSNMFHGILILTRCSSRPMSEYSLGLSSLPKMLS